MQASVQLLLPVLGLPLPLGWLETIFVLPMSLADFHSESSNKEHCIVIRPRRRLYVQFNVCACTIAPTFVYLAGLHYISTLIEKLTYQGVA